MEFCDVVNKLHDDDRLSNASAAERTYFASLQERANQVDYLDPCREQLRRSRLFHERWGRTMDGIILLRLDRSAFIHRVAGHIEYSAHDAFSHGHGDWHAAIHNLEAAL